MSYAGVEDMAPLNAVDSAGDVVGPHPSYIEIAKPYVFESKIRECLTIAGVSEAKDDSIRLQGVSWIDGVRKAMHLYGFPGFISSVRLIR